MTALAGTRVGAQRPDHNTSMRGDHWTQHAACAGMNTDLFYADGRSKHDRDAQTAAKAICAGCDVINQCREASTDERWGIWAGLTAADRGWANKGAHNATCDQCGHTYRSKHPRQRYCGRDCRREARREQDRESQARRTAR